MSSWIIIVGEVEWECMTKHCHRRTAAQRLSRATFQVRCAASCVVHHRQSRRTRIKNINWWHGKTQHFDYAPPLIEHDTTQPLFVTSHTTKRFLTEVKVKHFDLFDGCVVTFFSVLSTVHWFWNVSAHKFCRNFSNNYLIIVMTMTDRQTFCHISLHNQIQTYIYIYIFKHIHVSREYTHNNNNKNTNNNVHTPF